MKFTTPQAKDIVKIIDTATQFLSEATFRATKDGITVAALDPSNVAVIYVNMYQNMFLEYNIESDEEKFTINLEDLKKILKIAKQKDQIEFSLDKDKNKFVISIKGKSKKTFTLPLIESESNSIDIASLQGSLDLNIKAEMDAKAFAEIIRSGKVISDELKLKADPQGPKISFIAEGELKDMVVDITPQDESVLSLEVPSAATSKYSIDYLYKLTKVSNISDSLSFKFNENKPLWIDYKSADKFVFSFILAPRE